MKYELSETDKRLIDKVSDITLVDYEVDDDNYIKVENLIALIDDLETKYKKLEDKFVQFEGKIQESWHDHFINEQIDRGMHPSEYE